MASTIAADSTIATNATAMRARYGRQEPEEREKPAQWRCLARPL
jgi:hypothetical protein